MAGLIDSFKKFSLILVILGALSLATVYIFDQFVAAPTNLFVFSRETIRIIIIVGFWLGILAFSQRAKPFLTRRIGTPATAILQFFIGVVAVLVMTLGVLNTLGVSPQNLLIGAGIATITVGLVISTFVSGILSGALVFMTHSFRVGDDVLVNNIPGRILDMTALVTKIRTDVGQISIPNSAIASGSVIVVTVRKQGVGFFTRLPYSVGDRVVTTYMNEQGVVKELTPLHTVIALDSGKELTFLNNSILSGSVAIARIAQAKDVHAKTVKTTD